MTKIVRFAVALVCLGLAPALGGAKAQPNLTQGSCQAALSSLKGQWAATGLPAPPAGPLGGIQAKSGAMVRTAHGHATSLVNFQYMTIQVHAAGAACQAGDTDAAMEKVALVRDRLAALSR
jgi:hypothetical protein